MSQSDCKVCLLGIPFDHNSSFEKGPAEAPQVVRNVLTSGSMNKSSELGVDLKENPFWWDAGDVEIAADPSFEPIRHKCDELLEGNKRLLSVGGDHSVTLPIIQAYAKHYGQLNILHIDAHPDLYDEFKGNRFANACPFARIMEQGLCKRLVQVGIRTLNDHQREQASRFGVEVIQMKDFATQVVPVIKGPVYLSLDIDGIDPAFAPGVSHREPGGLSTRDVISLIHNIEGPLVGADLVEFNPRKDIDDLTAQVAGKLVKEIAGKMVLDLGRC